MVVPVDVLTLAAVAVLLLVFVVLAQFRAEKRLKKLLAEKDRPVQPILMVQGDGSPDPGPHDHVWSKKATGGRGAWRMYACTVPGCKADPLCKTGRE